MPNSFLPAYPQHRAPLARNVLLVGDALNMRHPLTGGGMTVGLSDVVMLSNLLGGSLKLPEEDVIDFEHDKEALLDAAETWYWKRKQNTATINVLAQALYSLFSAAGEQICFILKGGTSLMFVKFYRRQSRHPQSCLL